MTRDEWVALSGKDELLFLDPESFDAAIMGIVKTPTTAYVLYNEDAVIELLVSDGMSYDDAYEYYDFNIRGAWVGAGSPGFISEQWASMRTDDDGPVSDGSDAAEDV